HDPKTIHITLSIISSQNGTSNSIYAGEKAMRPDYYNGQHSWDECLLEGNGGTNRKGTHLLRDAVGISYANNWGSPFSSGTPFVMCDGHVHFSPYSASNSAVFTRALNYKNTVPFTLP